MDFKEKLRSELVEIRDRYYAAKNNYIAAKNGLKPDFVKEDIKLLLEEKNTVGHLLSIWERKCDLYGVDKK